MRVDQRDLGKTLADQDVSSVEPEIMEWVVRLRRSIVPLARHMRRESTGRFNPTQLALLGAIYRNGPIPIGELAGLERLSAPTVSKTVAALEAAGLVERLFDERDRRVCRVRVTAGGLDSVHEHELALDRDFAGRVAALPPEHQAALADAVASLELLRTDLED